MRSPNPSDLPLVKQVLSQYDLRPDEVQVEPLGTAGGWSGSRLWRVQEPGGRLLALRRWPEGHPTHQRLQFIHRVLLEVAKFLPAVAHPLPAGNGRNFVDEAGLWELTDWKPGVADFRSRPTKTRLVAAVQALARFHQLATRVTTKRGPPPAIADRIRLLQTSSVISGLNACERSLSSSLGDHLDLRAEQLIRLLRTAHQRSQAAAILATAGDLPLQPAIRDIHHEHVLFTNEEVTGLIDFGALRMDTPLTDVARLIGSLVGDDLETRNIAFNTYADLCPLTSADRAIIDALDESGLIIAGINWLNWLYVERRDMGPTEPIARRLDELIGRLTLRAG